MTVAYLDTSALAKLVLPEHESPALQRWLGRSAAPTVVTSALTRVELTRAAARRSSAALSKVPGVLSTVSLIAVSGDVLTDAAAVPPPTLRSLDAIHLATARRIGASLTAFVAYDERLTQSARNLGLPVVVPR